MTTPTRPPHEAIHPSLTDNALRAVAGVIVEWRHRKLATREPPDGTWNLGCDQFWWAWFGLRQAAEGEYAAWLRVEKRGLDFLMFIGDVPIKFFREHTPGQPTRTLRRSEAEQKAQQLVFGFMKSVPVEDVLRLAVETSADGHVTEVAIVRLSPNGDEVYRWPIPIEPAVQVRRITEAASEPVELGEPPVELPEDVERVEKAEDGQEGTDRRQKGA